MLIDEQGRQNGVKQFPRSHHDCLKAISYGNPFCHSAVLIRRSALESSKIYDEAFPCAEDLDLWFRLSRKWELRNLLKIMVKYRVWPQSATAVRLWETAHRARQVRSRAAHEFGFTPSRLARIYFTLAPLAAFFPARWVRAGFHVGINMLGSHSDKVMPEHRKIPVLTETEDSASHPAR